MRIKIVVLAFCIGAVSAYAAWLHHTRRSVSIELAPSHYELSYEMAWGSSMSQRFTLRAPGASWASTLIPWTEIWKRPYNSGAALYANKNMGTYYIADGVRLHTLNLETGKVTTTCNPSDIPPKTRLGSELTSSITTSPDITYHPEGLFKYIGGDEKAGSVPGNPPPSHYYSDLLYLGKVGVVAGRSRGRGVRFVPAGNADEPQLPIQISCG